MPRFDDTPRWKRELRWDPVAQKMRPPDRPPTRKQLDYLRDLCAKSRVPFAKPTRRREAQTMIRRLHTRRRGTSDPA